MVLTSARATATAMEKPDPLLAAGRVATFQNSAIFWGVKYAGSPTASRRRTYCVKETPCSAARVAKPASI
jgi:hypothetical protein